MGELITTRSRTSGAAVAILPLALMLVLAGTLAYLATSGLSMHTWLFVGDVDAAAALVVLGGLLFPAATLLACRIEGLASPHLTDHFRQSFLLYAAVIVGILALAASRENRGSLGYAISALGVAGASLGIAANAVALAARNWRARAI